MDPAEWPSRPSRSHKPRLGHCYRERPRCAPRRGRGPPTELGRVDLAQRAHKRRANCNGVLTGLVRTNNRIHRGLSACPTCVMYPHTNRCRDKRTCYAMTMTVFVSGRHSLRVRPLTDPLAAQGLTFGAKLVVETRQSPFRFRRRSVPVEHPTLGLPRTRSAKCQDEACPLRFDPLTLRMALSWLKCSWQPPSGDRKALRARSVT